MSKAKATAKIFVDPGGYIQEIEVSVKKSHPMFLDEIESAIFDWKDQLFEEGKPLLEDHWYKLELLPHIEADDALDKGVQNGWFVNKANLCTLVYG